MASSKCGLTHLWFLLCVWITELSSFFNILCFLQGCRQHASSSADLNSIFISLASPSYGQDIVLELDDINQRVTFLKRSSTGRWLLLWEVQLRRVECLLTWKDLRPWHLSAFGNETFDRRALSSFFCRWEDSLAACEVHAYRLVIVLSARFITSIRYPAMVFTLHWYYCIFKFGFLLLQSFLRLTFHVNDSLWCFKLLLQARCWEITFWNATLSEGLFFNQNGLFVFNLTPFHKKNFLRMHFFALHLNYFSAQLVNHNLLLVELFFKFLYILQFFYGIVGRPPFFLYLYIKVLLHFVLLFFKLVNQIALPSIFFLNFIDFVFCNNLFPLKFAIFFL